MQGWNESKRGWIVAGSFMALFIVSIVPIFSNQTLPLYDYPNHLARMHIIAQIDESATLQQFYTVRWSAIPNLAMEMIIPPVCSQNSSATSDELIAAVEAVGQAASRQTYRW
jgi:hypothetical protein